MSWLCHSGQPHAPQEPSALRLRHAQFFVLIKQLAHLENLSHDYEKKRNDPPDVLC